MAGRSNYQHCYVQEVRDDEIYQINWLEGAPYPRAHEMQTEHLAETGTIVSIIVDLKKEHITTFMAFSKGQCVP